MSKIELSDPVALRIPIDVLAEIEKIADVAERTRSWVMVRAMKLYLAGEGAQILKTAEGLRQLDNGESEDMDDVIADIEKIVRDNAA